MKTVILHIGMPKTGTSALQMFLPQNNEVLHENGIDYPTMPFRFEHIGPRRNGHFLAVYSEEDPGHHLYQKGYEEVRKAFLTWDKVILSDEFIWTQQKKEGFWESTIKGISALDAKIKAIVYLRSQDDQVESHWNQKVKDPKTRMTETFEEFMEEEGYFYVPYDYGDTLDRISSYIGKENITVRVYEKQQFFGGSLFSDFLNILGLSFSDKYTMPPFTANVRLPNSLVEIKRMINMAYLDDEVPDFYRDIISKTFHMRELTDVPEHHTSMFTPELRKTFMKKYEKQNEYVAREYLGRSDGILFKGHVPQLSTWEMDDHRILLDMIRVFATEGVFLYKRQQELEKKNKELEDKLKKMEASSGSKLEVLSKRLEEVYNSLPFRAYRKMRDKKDGK